jgi:predicted aspartyl protease
MAMDNKEAGSLGIPIQINNKKIVALLDTGAEATVVDEEWARQNGWKIM